MPTSGSLGVGAGVGGVVGLGAALVVMGLAVVGGGVEGAGVDVEAVVLAGVVLFRVVGGCVVDFGVVMGSGFEVVTGSGIFVVVGIGFWVVEVGGGGGEGVGAGLVRFSGTVSIVVASSALTKANAPSMNTI